MSGVCRASQNNGRSGLHSPAATLRPGFRRGEASLLSLVCSAKKFR